MKSHGCVWEPPSVGGAIGLLGSRSENCSSTTAEVPNLTGAATSQAPEGAGMRSVGKSSHGAGAANAVVSGQGSAARMSHSASGRAEMGGVFIAGQWFGEVMESYGIRP